jgi:hypothetical protein
MGTVANALAGAKSALASADNFTSSVEGHKPPSTFHHEYAHAPYSMAKSKPASKPGISSEAHDVGEGIKSRMENEDAARKTLNQ